MGKDSCNSNASAWVRRFAALVPAGGPVLDLACGGGRHTRLFLDLGYPVTALDKDIDQSPGMAGAEVIRADLEDGGPWPLGQRRFAGIVVTNYLWRPLLPMLTAALAADGVLIYETFAVGNEALGRPRNPDYLLRRGELLQAFADLTIVAYEDGATGTAVMQRLCAVNGPGPLSLNHAPVQ